MTVDSGGYDWYSEGMREWREEQFNAYTSALAKWRAERSAESVWDKLRKDDALRTEKAMENLCASFTQEERARIELLERCF